MTPVLRVRTSADLVALIPTLVGGTPRRSLVLLPRIRGSDETPVIRVDLPGGRDPATVRAHATRAVGLVARIRSVDDVYVFVFTDEAFGNSDWPAGLELVTALDLAMHEAGIGVRDAWCVAADGWGAYPGTFSAETDRGPRPLDRIGIAAGWTAEPREPSPTRTAAALVPPLGEAELATVHDELDWILETPAISARLRDPGRAAALWERMLRGRGEPGPGLLAQAVVTISDLRLRDGLMLQCLFGRSAGDRLLRAGVELTELRDGGAAPDPAVVDRLVDLMTGRGTQPPSRARAERASEILRLVAAAAGHVSPAPLAVLAWVEWARGRSTAAAGCAEAALEIDEYSFARLVLDLVEVGHLPDWVGVIPPP